MVSERVVVIGAGGIAEEWYSALAAEEIGVSAVVVRNRVEQASQRIRPYGFDCEVSTDLQSALRTHRPDFVVDLSEPGSHCGVTCTALETGAHVLGEKPMSMTMNEAELMVKASERTGRLYMVSQSARWSPENTSIRDSIANGAIGRVTSMHCQWFIAVHLEDFRKGMPHPLLLEGGIHQFDLARYLSGTEPVSVFATEYNPAGSWFGGNAAASCIFEMTEGVVFTYSGSFCAEGCFSSGLGEWRIVGERGTICLGHDQKPSGEIPIHGTGIMKPQRPIEFADPRIEGTRMRGALREMLAYIRTGRIPQTECHDNIRSMSMVASAIKSSEKGVQVAVGI